MYNACLILSVSLQFLTDPPSPPQNVSHTIHSSTPDIAIYIVSVEWDPPVDNGGRDELNYTVSISPSTQLSATVVTSTIVIVTADYNVNYTLSLTATNCAGDSTTVEYRLNVGREWINYNAGSSASLCLVLMHVLCQPISLALCCIVFNLLYTSEFREDINFYSLIE